MDRYSDQEWAVLTSVPWNDLPQELKDKTRRYRDDPVSQQGNSDSPYPYLT
jgi:hypothetical protein